MGAAIRLDDPKALGRFVPLGELEGDRLQELAAKSTLRSLAPGEALPSRGTQLHYLLSGTVELNPHGGEAERIKAGSERARHPICPPGGQCRVVARSAVTILIVDTELLELLMSWNGHTGGAYEVDEIETGEGGDWMSALLQNPALHRLPPQALRRLMAAIEPLEIGTGRDIVTQGDPSDAYYIVARGRCRVSRIPEPGAKPVTLAELGPGAAFGEEALLTDSRRNASVTATEPCLVLRLGRDAFAELLQHHLVPTVSAAEAAELEREGARRIDLRQSPDEKSGAIRIHLAELRLKAATLDKKRRYIACCEDGRQSAVAAFILNQQGFDVAVLEGGLGKPATPPRQEQASAPALEEHLKRERNARRQTEAQLKRERERQKALTLRIQELETQLGAQRNLEAEQRELTKQLKTLQRQLDERRETEEKLATERDALSRRIEELEARLDQQQHLETEQRKLTKQLETLQHQLDEHRESEEALAAERDALTRRIEELEARLEQQQTLESEQSKLTEQLETLQHQLDERRESEEKLAAERDALTQCIEELEARLNEKQNLETEQHELTKQLETLQHQLDERRESEEELTAERDALTQRIEELEARLNEQQHLETEQSELTKQLENLQHQLDERRESEEKLAAERDALTRRIEELEDRLEERQRLEADHDELTKQLEGLRHQLDQRQEIEERLTEERDTLARRIEALEEELERSREAGQEQQRLTEELAALQRAREEDEVAIESLRAELKEANLKASEAAITLEQLNETRQRLELDLERQQRAREALEQELESLRSQGAGLAEAAERAAALEREVECLTRELASRHDTIVMLEQENHRLQRRADEQGELSKKLEEIQAMLDARTGELERAKAEQARLEEALQRTDTERKEAQQAQERQHRKWQQERDALQTELDRAREEIGALEQRLARSREQEQQQQILEQRLERAERGHQDAEQQRQALEQEVDTLKEALAEAKRVSAMADQALIALKRQLKEQGQEKKKAAPAPATRKETREAAPLDDDALIRMAREALQETAGLTEADRAAPAPFCLTEEAPPKRRGGWIGKALAATVVLGALYLGAAYDPKATDFGSANAAPSAAAEPPPAREAIDPALRQSREAQLREEARRRLEQALGQAN